MKTSQKNRLRTLYFAKGPRQNSDRDGGIYRLTVPLLKHPRRPRGR